MVVDNASTDDSQKTIRTCYPNIALLETGINLGYAGGNNFGIRYALVWGSEYICILNNDVSVAPDFLEPMLSLVQHQERVGIVTPMLLNMQDRSEILSLGATFDFRTVKATHFGRGGRVNSQPVAANDVDIASGSALLVHRRVFEEVGLLPEEYFMYYEDAAWCLNIRRAGYRILCQPAARVWHKVSATLEQSSPWVTYYMTRNRLYFLEHLAPSELRRRAIGKALGMDLAHIASDWLHARRPHALARQYGIADFLTGRMGPLRRRLSVGGG